MGFLCPDDTTIARSASIVRSAPMGLAAPIAPAGWTPRPTAGAGWRRVSLLVMFVVGSVAGVAGVAGCELDGSRVDRGLMGDVGRDDTRATDAAIADGFGGDTLPAADSAASDIEVVDGDVGGDAAGDVARDVEDTADTADTADAPDTGPGCAAPVEITPTERWVFPLGAVNFSGQGGAGALAFSLIDDGSGALLNSISGAYLAGSLAGTVDRVEVRSAGCAAPGSAIGSAVVHVVEPMDVRPRRVGLLPGGGFTVSVGSGSGSYRVYLADTPAGPTGAVDALGVYVAGDTPGEDRLIVEDLLTGEQVDIRVVVALDAALRPAVPTLYLPVDAPWWPATVGGSGLVDLHVLEQPPGLVAVDGAWRATAAGSWLGTLVDRFSGAVTTQRIVGLPVAPQAVSRTGWATNTWSIQDLGDLDGDGLSEVGLGVFESSVGQFQSGAVYLWRGAALAAAAPGEAALEPEVLAGGEAMGSFGRSLEAADLNGDGFTDLIVSAYREDGDAVDSGVIHIFWGRDPAGLVGAEPLFRMPADVTLQGLRASDQLGTGLAICDFDGDGALDVAAGAWQAEDRGQSPIRYTQGAVGIFYQRADDPDGPFPADAAQWLWGKDLTADGGWVHTSNLRLASSLAAGDFDGDGVCDLAGGTLYRNANRGQVVVWRGQRAEPAPDSAGVGGGAGGSGGVVGGLNPIPVGAWTGKADGRLGHFLATGDVNGDGIADLLMSQSYRQGDDANNRRGGVRLVLGGGWAEEPTAAYVDVDLQALIPGGIDTNGSAEIAWSALGNPYDYLGFGVAIGQVDGAGPEDIVAGRWIGECAGCPSAVGGVHAWLGVDGGVPGADANVTVWGDAPGARFGTAVEVIDDLDGDGLAEWLVIAGYGDAFGLDVGEPYLVRSAASVDDNGTVIAAPLVLPLSLPGGAAGWEVGRSVAAVDFDGDGLDSLVVAAPSEPGWRASGGAHLYGGVVRVYPDQDDVQSDVQADGAGDTSAAATVLSDFTTHSAYDRMGWVVDDAGDFDGDGYSDLAVLSRSDDKPNSFGAAFDSGHLCPSGARSNVGSVLIFRGGPGGVATSPTWVLYGDQVNQNLDLVRGVGDVNGDGFADVVAGGRALDRPGATNAGGLFLWYGRSAAGITGTMPVCEVDWGWLGVSAYDSAGSAFAPLGDLDGDGCDELAVGAYLEDRPRGNAGVIRVIAGFGEGCARGTAYGFAVSGGASNDHSGWSLDGGVDLDGDGLSELAIGGGDHREGGVKVGGAWLLSGAWLAETLSAAEPLVQGQAPGMIYDLGQRGAWLLSGQVFAEDFGWEVALVSGRGGEAGQLAVASRFASVGGGEGVGVVRLYRALLDDVGALAGVAQEPSAMVCGEPAAPGGMTSVSVREMILRDGPGLGIGASRADGLAVDIGAAYVVPLLLEVGDGLGGSGGAPE